MGRSTERLAALSVDLDEIDCYAAIHGISFDGAHPIYDLAVPRFRAFFAALGIPATFFAIGRDLERQENRDKIRELSGDGHEIANHSYDHFYDLTRRGRMEARDEVVRGGEMIEAACGKPPVGFRAPGYTINEMVFTVLEELGYQYDSSVFPCPAYFSAKTAAIGWIRARGRRSHSVIDDPRVLRAPADPYRRGAPYWTKGDGILELPIGVTRTLTGRLPYIGTSVALSGAAGADMLTRAMAGRPLVNLELHGIDLADAKQDGLTALAPHQPDLRKTFREKEAALKSAVSRLKKLGYQFVTLSDAADAFR